MTNASRPSSHAHIISAPSAPIWSGCVHPDIMTDPPSKMLNGRAPGGGGANSSSKTPREPGIAGRCVGVLRAFGIEYTKGKGLTTEAYMAGSFWFAGRGSQSGRHRAVRQVRRLAYILGVIGVTACSDSTGPAAFAGAYHLVTLDGRSLPATYSLGAENKDDVNSETVIFADDGTFTLTRNARHINFLGDYTRNDTYTGTWAIDGKVLTMIYAYSGAVTGQWDGHAGLTVTNFGKTWAYVRG